MNLITDYRTKSAIMVDDDCRVPVDMKVEYTYLPDERLHGKYETKYLSCDSKAIILRDIKIFDNGRHVSTSTKWEDKKYKKIIHW